MIQTDLGQTYLVTSPTDLGLTKQQLSNIYGFPSKQLTANFPTERAEWFIYSTTWTSPGGNNLLQSIEITNGRIDFVCGAAQNQPPFYFQTQLDVEVVVGFRYAGFQGSSTHIVDIQAWS